MEREKRGKRKRGEGGYGKAANEVCGGVEKMMCVTVRGQVILYIWFVGIKDAGVKVTGFKAVSLLPRLLILYGSS